jgi:hypothetical protein
VLDGIDGGLKTVLPTPMYKTVNQVMVVYLKPAEQVKKAQSVITGGAKTQAEMTPLQKAIDRFLNSWLAIAAVVCTGVGLVVRVILNLTVWH